MQFWLFQKQELVLHSGFCRFTSNDSHGGALILSLEILLHIRIDLTMSHFPSYSAKIFV